MVPVVKVCFVSLQNFTYVWKSGLSISAFETNPDQHTDKILALGKEKGELWVINFPICNQEVKGGQTGGAGKGISCSCFQ